MSLDDTTYGWDVSNYQADLTEQHFRNAKNEGIEFSIALATDGTGFQNFMFSRQLDWGRKVGMLTASYHYVRDASISQQIANIKRTVPLDCPVIPDSETGSGGIGVLNNIINALLSEGYRVPLEYLPRWYWQQIGSPWLGGRGRPMWASWYPDYVRRNKENGAAMLPLSVWSGYGGAAVAITQFTSSGVAAGYDRALDLNKFRGTRSELAALFGGGQSAPGGGGSSGEDDFLMGLPQWQQERIFDRILRMSAGVAGQNFNGEQYDYEQSRLNELSAKLDAIYDAVKPVLTEVGPPAEEGGEAPTALVAPNWGIANLYGQVFYGSNHGWGPAITTQLAKILEEDEVVLDPKAVEGAVQRAVEGANAAFLTSIRKEILAVLGEHGSEQADEILRKIGRLLSAEPAVDTAIDAEIVPTPLAIGQERPASMSVEQDVATKTTEEQG